MVLALLILVILSFLLCFLKSKKLALIFIVATLPFNYPFDTFDIFSQGLSLSVVLIYLYAVLNLFNRKPIPKGKTDIDFKQKKILFLLLYGLIIGLFQLGQGLQFPDKSDTPELQQLVYATMGYLSIPVFISLLSPYQKDLVFIQYAKKIFVFTILLQLIGYTIGISHPFTSDLFYFGQSDSENLGIDIIRYKSLLSDYELSIDYLFILITLSYVLWLESKKKIYIAVIISAVFLSLTTGTRSFILIISTFFALNLLLRRGNTLSKLYTVGAVLITVIVIMPLIANGPLGGLPIFARAQEVLTAINNKETLSRVTNRNFSKSFDNISSDGNVLGLGPFYLNIYKGDQMVSHNFMLALLAKFGLLGVVLFIFLMIRFLFGLWKTSRRTIGKLDKNITVIYLSAVICLIIQELKISALRFPNILLIYAVFFFVVSVHQQQANTRRLCLED